MFDSIADIIKHVRRKHSHQVYMGKDYSVDDCCNDLTKIKEDHEREIAELRAVIDKLHNDLDKKGE